MISKKTMFMTLAVIAVVLFATTGEAFAQGAVYARQDVFGVVAKKGVNVFKAVKAIMFIVGGFGLVAVAAAAIFGKISWKVFSYLAVGLMILAAAGAIIDYATDDTTNVMATEGAAFGDTLGKSGF